MKKITKTQKTGLTGGRQKRLERIKCLDAMAGHRDRVRVVAALLAGGQGPEAEAGDLILEELGHIRRWTRRLEDNLL